MNKILFYFFFFLTLILSATVYLFGGPMMLFFINYKTDLLKVDDVYNHEIYSNQSAAIPKIIHQTWKTNEIPEKWVGAQKSCIDLHPDYEYVLWTDESMREFIATDYPWFLTQYDSYPYNIERADVVRYFILYKYGGIYLDLDVGCNRTLDPLLHYPAWVRRTSPSGISNNVMGFAKGHPFLLQVVRNLPRFAFNYHFPYLTVMYSTGPLFLSIIWSAWRKLPDAEAWHHIWVMVPELYEKSQHAFFEIYEGSSWHDSDAGFVFYMLHHWAIFTFLGFLTFFIVVYFIFGYALKPAARVSRTGRRIFSSPFSKTSPSRWKIFHRFTSSNEKYDQSRSDSLPFMSDYDLESQTQSHSP